MPRDTFAPLRAAYKRALVDVKRERKEGDAILRRIARELPELAPLIKQMRS